MINCDDIAESAGADHLKQVRPGRQHDEDDDGDDEDGDGADHLKQVQPGRQRTRQQVGGKGGFSGTAKRNWSKDKKEANIERYGLEMQRYEQRFMNSAKDKDKDKKYSFKLSTINVHWFW